MFVHERTDLNERFRERRRQARRRRRLRRAAVACVLVGAAAAIAAGATFISRGSGRARAVPLAAVQKAPPLRPAPVRRAVPSEIRGVHVTMALASLPGRLYDYLALRAYGLNTVELD